MEKAFVIGQVYCDEYLYDTKGYPVTVFTDKEKAEKFVIKKRGNLKKNEI